MTLGQWFLREFSLKTKGSQEIWCLKDDSCERWNVRHHPSNLSQASRDWNALNANCHVVRVVQRFLKFLVFLFFRWFSGSAWSCIPACWKACGFRSPLHLSRGSWFDLPRTESATCGSWVFPLMFEVLGFLWQKQYSKLKREDIDCIWLYDMSARRLMSSGCLWCICRVWF